MKTKLINLLSLFFISFCTYAASNVIKTSLGEQATVIDGKDLENQFQNQQLQEIYGKLIHISERISQDLSIKNQLTLPDSQLCFTLGSFNSDFQRSRSLFAKYRSAINEFLPWQDLHSNRVSKLDDHAKNVNQIMVFARNEIYADAWNNCVLDEKISKENRKKLSELLVDYKKEMEKGLTILPQLVKKQGT